MKRMALLILCILLLPLTSVFAHGSMETPLSRIYRCYKEGPENVQTDACKAFVAMSGKQPLYDWDMVNQFGANSDHKAVVPDGMLCAGGREKYKGLDLARLDWPTTSIKGDNNNNYTFVFKATVPHLVKYFELFMTKDGYDFNQPMKWADVESFCKLENVPLQNGTYQLPCKLPNKTGRRIVYAIWQRTDSAEAFYSCSDIILDTMSTSWNSVGSLTAYRNEAVNSTLTFWLIKDCNTVESHSIQLTTGQNGATQWPFALGEMVNASSSLIRIGEFNNQTGVINPQKSATANKVFVSDPDTSRYHFIVDIAKPGMKAKRLIKRDQMMRICKQK